MRNYNPIGNSINGVVSLPDVEIEGDLRVSGNIIGLTNETVATAIFTNTTTTNAFINNGNVVNLSGTNSTITNLVNTNISSSNARITNSLHTNISSSTARITSLFGTVSSFTNSNNTNVTSTNIRSTNITSNNLIVSSQNAIFSVSSSQGNIILGTNGNVGILTQNPQHRLDIGIGGGLNTTFLTSGNALITNLTCGSNISLNLTSGFALISNLTSTNITSNNLIVSSQNAIFSVSSSQGNIILGTNGNVGIGTTSPSAVIDLANGSDNTGAGGSSQIALQYRSSAGGGFRHFITSRHDNTPGNGNAIDFYINNSGVANGSTGASVGNINSMSITGSGINVNGTIRTTSSITAGNIQLFNSNSTMGIFLSDQNKGVVYSGANNGLYWSNNFPTDGPVLFGWSDGALGTRSSGNAVTLMWNNSGNVGIGTTSPVSRLHVNNNGGNNYLTISGPANAQQAIEFRDTASRWIVYKPGSSADLRFYNSTGGYDAFTMTSQGSFNCNTYVYNQFNVGNTFAYINTNWPVFGDKIYYTFNAYNNPATNTWTVPNSGYTSHAMVLGFGGVEFLHGSANGLAPTTGSININHTGVFPYGNSEKNFGASNLRWNNIFGSSININGSNHTLGSLIVSGSNIGIGTTSPASLLQIDSPGISFQPITIRGNSVLDLTGPTSNTSPSTIVRMARGAPGGFAFGANSVEMKVYRGYTTASTTLSNTALTFYLNPSSNDYPQATDDVMTMWANKRVGIATSNPNFTLDVNGSFEANNSNGSLVLTTSGNVGIGTTTPDINVKLRVEGGAIQCTSNDGDKIILTQITNGNKISQLAGWGLGLYAGRHDSNEGFIAFHAGNQTERMRITNDGYVGINISGPTAPLNVNGKVVIGRSTTTNDTFLEIDRTSITGGTVFIQAVKTHNVEYGNLSLNPNYGSGTGYVGIGTTAPAYQLTVASDSAAKPSTNTWTISSDARLKTNITQANLDTCYNNVKNIPLKRYTWLDSVYTENQVPDRSKLGWIAQDVENILPKSVEQKNMYGIEDCRTLNSDQIIACLYGAVQKLIEKVEQLESN